MLNDKENAAFLTKNVYKVILSAIQDLITVNLYCWVGFQTLHMNEGTSNGKYAKAEAMPAPDGLQRGQVPLTCINPQMEIPFEPYQQ